MSDQGASLVNVMIRTSEVWILVDTLLKPLATKVTEDLQIIVGGGRFGLHSVELKTSIWVLKSCRLFLTVLN